MGKFDGYLICSDLDGTFRAGADAAEINSEAVKYFTANGGKFTFTTGRAIGHLYECNFHSIINAPAALCNGGIIYDYEEKRVIRLRTLDYTVGDFIETIKSKLHLKGTIYIFDYRNCEEYQKSVAFADAEKLPSDIKDIRPIKIVCAFTMVDEAEDFKNFALNDSLFATDCVAKSWSTGVEFNSLSASKGEGIKFIKNHIGNIHTSIGVGDYENDMSLIENADIGVAVGNAVDELKAIADMIVKPATEYAIKDLIEKIEKGI